MRNASATASGTYRCTASNRVGSEECILYLNVTPREYPKNSTQYSACFTFRLVAHFSDYHLKELSNGQLVNILFLHSKKGRKGVCYWSIEVCHCSSTLCRSNMLPFHSGVQSLCSPTFSIFKRNGG